MVTLPSGGRMRGVSVDLLSMGNADVKRSGQNLLHPFLPIKMQPNSYFSRY